MLILHETSSFAKTIFDPKYIPAPVIKNETTAAIIIVMRFLCSVIIEPKSKSKISKAVISSRNMEIPENIFGKKSNPNPKIIGVKVNKINPKPNEINVQDILILFFKSKILLA